MNKLLKATTLVVSLALVSAACGSDDSDDGAASTLTDSTESTQESVAADTVVDTVEATEESVAPATTDGADAAVADGEPITVGVVNALTGPGATAGVPAQNVFDALLDQTNASGGVNGRPIELVVFDDKTDPTEATRGVAELSDQGAVAILGPLTGTAILAAGPVAAQQETPLIVFAGTQTITDPSDFSDWIFRAAPADVEYWRAATAQIAEDDAIQRVAIIAEETAYGDNAVATVTEELDGTGVEIVEVVNAPADAVDVTAQATRVADADPDAVIMAISIGSLAVSFTKARAQIGLDVPMFANPSVTSTGFLDAVGPDADGIIATAYANLGDPTPRVEEGVMALAEEYGFDNTGFAELLAGNSWATLIAALESQDGEITGSSMRDALDTTCGVVGFMESEGCFSPDDHDGWKADSVILVRINADGTLTNL